jgi:hypothetical protein
MMRKLLLSVLMAAVGIIVCNAAKIDGKWKTTVEGPNGSMEIVFTFKVDGEKLTGTNSSSMGEFELKDGKVNENEFSFKVDLGMGEPIIHKCKVDGDVIKMKIEMGEMGGDSPNEFILKRVE